MFNWTPPEYGRVPANLTSEFREREYNPGISESQAEIRLRLLLT
jgi:hypothetical protein